MERYNSEMTINNPKNNQTQFVDRRTVGELLKTFETNSNAPKEKPKKIKGDIISILKFNFPKLTDEHFQNLLKLKETTENYIKQTITTKSNTGYLKSLVSKAKTRFCYDGFDLDLTYITKRIINLFTRKLII